MATKMARDSDFKRLQEEQNRSLEASKHTLTKLQTFDEDYDALHRKLTNLPAKVSHDVMVPFGRLGFMQGQLVHTNEIHVLLGDNWFALRSALQATQIVERRRESVRENIDACKRELQNLRENLNYTQELLTCPEDGSGVVEIKEEVQGNEGTPVHLAPGSEGAVVGGRKRRVAHKPKWTKNKANEEKRNSLSGSERVSAGGEHGIVSRGQSASAEGQNLPDASASSLLRGGQRQPGEHSAPDGVGNGQSRVPSQDSAWTRLEELERQEQEQGEASETLPLSSSVKVHHGKEDVKDEEEVKHCRRITFQHSASLPPQPKVPAEGSGGEIVAVGNPGDIFTRFSSQPQAPPLVPSSSSSETGAEGERRRVRWSRDLEEVRSIPRRGGGGGGVGEKQGGSSEREGQAAGPRSPLLEEAFSGLVLERAGNPSHVLPGSLSHESTAGAKKVSKFKSSKQKR